MLKDGSFIHTFAAIFLPLICTWQIFHFFFLIHWIQVVLIGTFSWFRQICDVDKRSTFHSHNLRGGKFEYKHIIKRKLPSCALFFIILTWPARCTVWYVTYEGISYQQQSEILTCSLYIMISWGLMIICGEN